MKKILLFVIASFFVFDLYAGEAITPFLKISGSSRQDALGGAYAAMPVATDAVGVNPAGLFGIKGVNAYITYFSLFEGIEFTKAFVGNDFAFGVVSFSMSNLDSGKLSQTVLDSAGKVIPTQQNFGVSGKSFVASYANVFFWDLALGASLKLVREDFIDPPFTTVAIDIGAQKQFFKKRLLTGFSVFNLSPPRTRAAGSSTDPVVTDLLPLTARLGLGYRQQIKKDHELVFLTDLEFAIADPVHFRLGLEYTFRNFISIRMGYIAGSADQGITSGIGVKTSLATTEYILDYGLQNHAEFGITNQFTFKIGYKWQKQVKEKVEIVEKIVEKKKFSPVGMPLSWDQITRMASAGSDNFIRIVEKNGEERTGKLVSVLPDELEIDQEDDENIFISKDNIIIMFVIEAINE